MSVGQVRFPRWVAFNSLFEMLEYHLAVRLRNRHMLSILYLRCKEDGRYILIDGYELSILYLRCQSAFPIRHAYCDTFVFQFSI